MNREYSKLDFYKIGLINRVLLPASKIGDFTLSSGKKSDFYIDLKEEMLNWFAMHIIGQCIRSIKELHDLEFSMIAGVTSGADPIICGSIYEMPELFGLFIRKSQKEYGTGKIIEGKIPENEKDVLIVDDVLTTGKNLKHAYDVLKEHELNPVGMIVVVDREENDAKNIIEKYTKIPLFSIAMREEILKYKKNSDFKPLINV